jgi:phosphate transport system protein
MPVHLQREIEKLKKQVILLGAAVEENVRRATEAVVTRNSEEAEATIQSDDDVDSREVDVEEECLKILALHQPVAIDLRYIVAILKIDQNLERISDLAVHIAESSLYTSTYPLPAFPIDVRDMADKAQAMLRQSLDALIRVDAKLARKVWIADDEIDRLHHEFSETLEAEMHEHPDRINPLIQLLTISRNLERIADHAASIAKDVIYLEEGVIVRHKGRIFKNQK